jgi:hypothetical protein
MKKTKTKIINRERNWLAIHAWNKGKKGGSMGDKKKQQSKEECRKWKND